MPIGGESSPGGLSRTAAEAVKRESMRVGNTRRNRLAPVTEAPRSEITIDRAALRSNLRRLRDGARRRGALGRRQGERLRARRRERSAQTRSRRARTVLCVATVGEGLELRGAPPEARILVLGRAGGARVPGARARARLELVVAAGPLPEGIPLHVKVDTGHGPLGVPGRRRLEPRRGRA